MKRKGGGIKGGFGKNYLAKNLSWGIILLHFSCLKKKDLPTVLHSDGGPYVARNNERMLILKLA